jgi:signal transduction histidine kinase
MKRLKFFILVFSLAVSIPLAYVTWQTYAGMAQEERAQLSYFSEALFDEMEKDLADLIQKEENRSVEEYQHILVKEGSRSQPSPLSGMPTQPYIIGYLQNNPDGSFQTPLVADLKHVPENHRRLVDQLSEINRVFNQKKFSIPASVPAVETKHALATGKTAAIEEKKHKSGLADRYISKSLQKTSKSYLGKKEVRTEEITAQQALNVARRDRILNDVPEDSDQWPPDTKPQAEDRIRYMQDHEMAAVLSEPPAEMEMETDQVAPDMVTERFHVEVAPFQSVFINKDQAFIFRRIAIRNQIYRQGFIIDVSALLTDLADHQFNPQPLSEFMSLHMRIMDHGQNNNIVQFGLQIDAPRFSADRRFPAPFNFISVALQADAIPGSPARRPLNVALIILGSVLLIGLFAIYHSARTVVDMSERRSQFVSSVTHELKTPLTNIRMYIEMLEQGIAATPEREQEYLHVLGAESVRLSRLINNVLELAKLEKKQRRFQYQEGNLEDVFSEIKLIMSQKLKQEDFSLTIMADKVPCFSYDREVVIQLLVNLIENSIKFGKQLEQRRLTITADPLEDYIRIALSDTGPGIPRRALKKVFNDFYRVDNELTRATGGTGIGLALVKKFVVAMGGKVQATNNTGPGCTIILQLPRHGE